MNTIEMMQAAKAEPGKVYTSRSRRRTCKYMLGTLRWDFRSWFDCEIDVAPDTDDWEASA